MFTCLYACYCVIVRKKLDQLFLFLAALLTVFIDKYPLFQISDLQAADNV